MAKLFNSRAEIGWLGKSSIEEVDWRKNGCPREYLDYVGTKLSCVYTSCIDRHTFKNIYIDIMQCELEIMYNNILFLCIYHGSFA